MTSGTFALVLGLLAADPFPPLRVYSHNCKLVAKYDRIKDAAAETVDLGKISIGGNLELTVCYFYRGTSRPAAKDTDEVHFHLVSQSREWEFLKYRDCTVLVDGARIRYGEPKHDGEVGDGYVLEQMWVDMSVPEFLKYANAHSVEGKLGTQAFRLSDDQLVGLRDFAARLGAPQRRSRQDRVAAGEGQERPSREDYGRL